MDNLTRIELVGGSVAWRVACEATHLDDQVVRARNLEKVGFNLILRGARMRSRAGVFHEFAAALQFPHYFGMNWNAFDECICDLAWLSEGDVSLWIADADVLLKDADPDEFGVLLATLGRAVNELGEVSQFRPRRSLKIVLQSEAQAEHALLARLATQETESGSGS